MFPIHFCVPSLCVVNYIDLLKLYWRRAQNFYTIIQSAIFLFDSHQHNTPAVKKYIIILHGSKIFLDFRLKTVEKYFGHCVMDTAWWNFLALSLEFVFVNVKPWLFLHLEWFFLLILIEWKGEESKRKKERKSFPTE